jgi:hypothetical protein
LSLARVTAMHLLGSRVNFFDTRAANSIMMVTLFCTYDARI